MSKKKLILLPALLLALTSCGPTTGSTSDPSIEPSEPDTETSVSDPSTEPSVEEFVAPEFISLIGAIGGTTWDTDFDLSTSDEGHTWVIEDFAMNAGEEWKIRKNHNWGTAGIDNWGYSNLDEASKSLFAGSDNIVVGETGNYTITFDYDTMAISATYEAPAPVVTGIEITNKEDLKSAWFVGEADRNVNYKINYSDGTSKARGATIASSNTDVVSYPGGVKIHAVAAGTATITATINDFSDSVEVTVSELNPEETVTVAELISKPVNDATAYIVTGYIVQYQYADSANAGAYGNFYLADKIDDDVSAGILVYGASEVQESLVYDDAAKTWSWSNPNKWEPSQPFPFDNYGIGDKVTMKGLRFDYGTKVEFNGIILDHEKKPVESVTSVEFKKSVTSLGNGYSYSFLAQDNNGEEKVTYSVEGDAATMNGAKLVADATKTGKVTVKATSTVDTSIVASVDVEIVANPAIVDATLEQVINGDATKGGTLYRVTAKTVANEKTSDTDVYGNFDYTDGTNTITSYGLSANATTISYYNNVWNFSNDKSFANTGVEVGSDKEYTVIVMRSDYNGTKQLVGYIAPASEPENPNPENPETPTTSEIVLTVDSLALPSSAYSAGKATVDSVEFEYIQLGNYGDGIQMRDKDGNTSFLWNNTAFAAGVERIELTFASTKSTYNNADAVIFSFGSSTEVSSYSTKLSTVAGEKSYTITPDANTYTFFKLEHDIGYSFYWAEIKIVLGAASETPDTPDTPDVPEHTHTWENGVCTDETCKAVCEHNFVDDTCTICGTVNKTETPDTPATVTVSRTVADLIKEYGWTGSTTKQSFNLDDNVGVKINGGNNTGKAYNNDHIRIYATDTPAGTITISVPEGYELVSIKISAQTGTYAFLCLGNDKTDICNKETAVSGSSVVLNSVKNGSDGKQVRVTAFEVVYKSTAAAETPDAPEVEEPTPVVDNKIYFISEAWWQTDNATTSFYYWGVDGAAGWPGTVCKLEETLSDGRQVWSFDIDVTTLDGFIFVRTASGAAEGSTGAADWGAKTADLSAALLGDNNCIVMTNETIWGNPGVNVSFHTYVPGQTAY